MQESLRKIFIITILFFFVFGIPFSFLPVNSSKIVVLILLPLGFVYFLASRGRMSVKREYLFITLILVLLVVIAVIYPIIHQTYDFSVAYNYFIMLAEAFLGAVVIVWLWSRIDRNLSFNKLIFYFVCISLIQSLIILSMLVSGTIRDFFFSIQSTPHLVDLYIRYGGFRGLGLAASTTYDLAVLLATSLLFITYLIKNRVYNVIILSLIFVLIMLAMLITGRSGLIGLMFVCMFMLVGLKYKATWNTNFQKISVLVVVLAVASVYLFNSSYSALFVEKLLPYAFEIFYRLFESGQVGTASSDHLMAMYFPISIKTILLGDGWWISPFPSRDGNYYMATDAGYMRHILFYGVFPSVLLYAFYLLGFWKMAAAYRQYNQYATFLIFFMCLYYFTVHIKGDFLTGSPMNIKMFFLFLVFSIHISAKNVRIEKL